MRWTNEPKKWKQNGDQIKITCPGEVDYWRHTMHGFVKDDAPFYWMYVDYDFEARLSFNCKLRTLYDQAGMMVRLDEENWVKAGVVMYRDTLHVSVVFTRGCSDWSTHRLPIKKLGNDGFHIWVKRIGEVIEVLYSLDNENWIRVRQGHFVDAPRLRVGMMCAAPESDGFKVTFDDFMIKGVETNDEEESYASESDEESCVAIDNSRPSNPALENGDSSVDGGRDLVTVEDVSDSE